MRYRNLILASVLTVSTLCGCTKDEKTDGNSWQTMQNVTLDSGFDTVITLIEQTEEPEAFESHFKELCGSFSYYNSLFDIYNDYDGLNNLKTVNDQAGIAPVKVDAELIELLKKGQEFYELSDGAFDITIGSLLNVWHEYRTAGIALNEQGKRAPLPQEEELKQAAQHRGFDAVEIDEEAGTVFITDPDVRIDVGGIAKGFAAEKTARKLEELGTDHAAINAGGNNRTIGSKRDGTPWNVGIQNPDGEGVLFLVRIDGTNSFVTSGDYERFYIGENGKRYQHIIDPETLYPANRYRSVTVITPDSGDADCLSTALTVLSIDDGKKLLENYRNQSGASAEAIWILPETVTAEDPHLHRMPGYNIVYTGGLEDCLVWN